jgi:hypothetical protein
MKGIVFKWAVDPEDAGTITSDGNFTAGDKEQKCNIVCSVSGIVQKVPIIIIELSEQYLQAAGEQLVSDAQTAWTSFTQGDRLTTILYEELMPHTELVFRLGKMLENL